MKVYLPRFKTWRKMAFNISEICDLVSVLIEIDYYILKTAYSLHIVMGMLVRSRTLIAWSIITRYYARRRDNVCPLQWRHNECDSVSNHQPHDCLLNRLIMHRLKKTAKLRVIGLCVGNSPVTGEFPAQKANNAKNVSIWWRHHANRWVCEPAGGDTYPSLTSGSWGVLSQYLRNKWSCYK